MGASGSATIHLYRAHMISSQYLKNTHVSELSPEQDADDGWVWNISHYVIDLFNDARHCSKQGDP